MIEYAGMWSGKTVCVLAGGPSLSAAQIRTVAMARLSGRCRVIAVNDAVYLAWWADWLHAYDWKWWHWHIDRVQHFRGIKTAVDVVVPAQWVDAKLERTGAEGFEPHPWGVRGNNGGQHGIHIAIHAGAKRIFLVGFDMKGSHWFGRHPDGREDERAELMAPGFASLLPTLRDRGIAVINASPDSALDCFQKGELVL